MAIKYGCFSGDVHVDVAVGETPRLDGSGPRS